MKKTLLLLTILYHIFNLPNCQIYSKTQVNVLLDCVNYSLYDFSNPIKISTFYTRPLSFTLDTSLFLQFDSLYKDKLISAWADLSSETGEPLFSRLAGSGSQNREHGTHGGCWFQFPKINLKMMGNYRHLGIYSDRIEQYWADYASKYGTILPYSNTGDFGIAENITVQWLLNNGASQFRGIFNNYGEWITVPGLYIPVYRKGNIYTQDFSFPLLSGSVFLTSKIDFQSFYSDHSTKIENNQYSILAKYKYPLNKIGSLQLHGSVSSQITSHYQLALSFTSPPDNGYTLSMSAGLWSGLEPDAILKFSYPIFKQCTLTTEYNYNFYPGEKSISILTPSDTIITKFLASHSNNMSISSKYADVLKIPLDFFVKIQYFSSPQCLDINTIGLNKLTAQFKASDYHAVIFGSNINLKLPYKDVLISLWNNINLVVSGKPFEFTPFESGFDLSYSSRSTNPIISNVKLIWRGPYYWNSIFNGCDSIISTSESFFSEFQISIPFISPIFTQHIAPNVTINAGPISIYPSKRVQFHPFGSKIGPQISVILRGDLIK